MSSVSFQKKEKKASSTREGHGLTLLSLPLPPHVPIPLGSIPLSSIPRVPSSSRSTSTFSRLVRISGAVPLPVVSSFPLSSAAPLPVPVVSPSLPSGLLCSFSLLPLGPLPPPDLRILLLVFFLSLPLPPLPSSTSFLLVFVDVVRSSVSS